MNKKSGRKVFVFNELSFHELLLVMYVSEFYFSLKNKTGKNRKVIKIVYLSVYVLIVAINKYLKVVHRHDRRRCIFAGCELNY